MSRLPFAKLHGTANDFVYVDGARALPRSSAALARRLCDRHRGIGADGSSCCARPRAGADCRMEMYNADGSRARDVRQRHPRRRQVRRRARPRPRDEPLRVETDAGVKTWSR